MESGQNDKSFRPILNTAVSLMKSRGLYDYCQLVLQAEISIAVDEFNGWSNEAIVSLNLPVKTYASLTQEKVSDLEVTLGDTLDEVIKANHYYIVQVLPSFTVYDIDWEQIGGLAGKNQLKTDIETIRDLMISVSTGGYRIQDVDDRYKRLNNSIIQRCKRLSIRYDNNFVGLWDWYGKWSAVLPSYQSRREFINQLFNPTLSFFEDNNDTLEVAVPIVELSEWERINRTVIKIKQDSRTAQEEEDFQKIGVLCRDVIISLAQAVYNPEIHGTNDENGVPIGKADAVRMIGNYVSVKLAGSINDELRAYAKATNKLANHLTHKRDASRSEMLMTVSATIALINFIGVLEGKT